MECLDYIIPLCNIGGEDFQHRVQNLNFLLKEFLNKQTKIHLHVILVEQITKISYPKFLDEIQIPEGMDVTKITVHFPVFVKPWLYNIGVSRAKSEHIIIGESDVYGPKDYFENLVRYVTLHKIQWCFIWDNVVKLTQAGKATLLHSRKLDYTGAQTITPRKNCCEGMGVYFSKTFWWDTLGGANEMFRELGCNDNELAYRASQYSKTYIKYPMTLIHLWHPTSQLKPCSGKTNSIEINRELRVYVIARFEAFTSFLKQRGVGKTKPIIAKVEDVFVVPPQLRYIAKSVRQHGSYCPLPITVLNNLKEPDKSRIRDMIQFCGKVKTDHANLHPYVNRKSIGLRRYI